MLERDVRYFPMGKATEQLPQTALLELFGRDGSPLREMQS